MRLSVLLRLSGWALFFATKTQGHQGFTKGRPSGVSSHGDSEVETNEGTSDEVRSTVRPSRTHELIILVTTQPHFAHDLITLLYGKADSVSEGLYFM